MTSYVMKTLRGISDIGISIDPGLVKRTNDYLRTRYIADYREGCNGPKEECSYTLDEKLAALEALALWSRDAEEVAGYLSSLPRDNWNLSQKISSLSVQAAIYTNK
jgi:hypothetical protein